MINFKWIGIALGIVALGVGIWWINRADVSDTPPDALGPGDIARVIVKGKNITTITPRKTVKEYAPGGADIRLREGGDVIVNVRKFGFSLAPGMGVAYADSRIKLGVDVRLIYWRRMGGHFGFTLDPTMQQAKDIVRPAAFASYALPIRWLEDLDISTSLCLGSELFPQRTMGQIRWGF